MLIIDRYLVRLFVKVLLVCFVSLTGLYIVIDAFNNLEEFISYGEREGSLTAVLVEYYGAHSLEFFDWTSGLIALTAAIFAVTLLQRSNELTALMAAGITKARIVRPLICGYVIVSLLAVVNREVLMPLNRDKLVRNAQDWMGDTAKRVNPQFDHETEVFISGLHAIASERKIEQPNFRLFTPLGTFDGQLSAASAEYQPPDGDRPGGYLLRGVTAPHDLGEHPSGNLAGKCVIFSPRDTPWLSPDECFVASAVDFQQLVSGDKWRHYGSLIELIAGMKNPSLDYGPNIRVEIHSRLVKPVLDLTLLLLGLPLVLSQHQRNIFLAASLCLAVVAGFLLVVLACHALGSNGLLSPALSAWCPLMLFVPLAVKSAHKLWE